MNLNDNPTLKQLKELIANCDDDMGHHVLWVDENGEVFLSQVPDDLTPLGFVESQPTLKLQYPSFVRGNKYVGVDAANDHSWSEKLLNSLISEWQQRKDRSGSEYIDMF